MADFDLKIIGLDEVVKALSQIPEDLNEKIQIDLAKKGAKIVQEELKQTAPEGNNDKKSKQKIGDNIIIKGTPAGAIVGFTKRVFYVKFLELGTKIRQTLGKGKYGRGANRGQIGRKPFINQAHNNAAPKVVEYMNTNYLSILNNAIKKQLKKIK